VHPQLDLTEWDLANRDTSLIIADGANVSVNVHSGVLVIKDGPMGDTRERRFARVPRTVKHLAILCTHGFVSLDAQAWLYDCDITWSVIDRSGKLPRTLAVSARYTDPSLMRKQASCAPGMPGWYTGVRINRHLIEVKLEGQADNCERILRDTEASKAILALRDRVRVARSLDTILGLEGNAADVYWDSWRSLPLVWRRPLPKQAHWLVYPSRKTLRMGWETNRHATDPINAALNFGYKAAETECTLACYAVNLSPAMGIAHVDRTGRDSFALDLLEVMRPRVDAIILGVMAERLIKANFWEDKEGIVRVSAPLTHRIISEVHAERYAIAQALFTVIKHLNDIKPRGNTHVDTK
jgi:hypothetical protein